MTPPCPNCGTIHHETTVRGRRSSTIDRLEVFDDTFHGFIFICQKCRHRWRVAIGPQPSRPCSS